MKKSRPTVFAIALLASAWASPVAAELAPRLVEYIAGVGQGPDAGDTAAGLSPLRSETLEAILANPSAVDVRIGQASLEAMRSARALSLVLPRSAVSEPELLASFDDLEITERSEHDYSVYGRNESPESEVSLVVLGEDVVGTIRFEGEVYDLRPLGGGLTAVYRRDTSQWDGAECGVTDHPRLSVPRNRDNGARVAPGARPQTAAPPDLRAPATPGDGGEVIDVLVAHTRGARSAAGNIDALIRHFFDDTNRFFVAALAADDGSMHHYVPIFNPASNFDQQSRLRLVNSGDSAASVRIDGRDDACDAPPEGSVSLTLDPGAAHLITARELEQGSEDSSGQFGAGEGKWQLFVSSDQPIQVMSLLLSPTGNLTNLSP